MSGGRRLGGYAAAVVILLAGWALLAWAIDSPALPGPLAAFGDFFTALGEGLVEAFVVSAARVFVAIGIALLFAVPLGLAVGRSPRADAVFAPLVFLTYPIPKIVFLPVLLVLLGTGEVSKVVLIAIIVFFQILVTARDAAKSIPEASVLSVRSLGAGVAQVYRHVVVPASLPAVFTALRIAAGTAVAVLFISETVAGTSGLGFYIMDAWGRIDYGDMFAGIIAMGLLGILLYEVIEFAEGRLCRWTKVGGRTVG